MTPVQAPEQSSVYDAETVGEFFRSINLKHGYALLDREQPEAITLLKEDIILASEQEQAWKLPERECCCYIPVGGVNW